MNRLLANTTHKTCSALPTFWHENALLLQTVRWRKRRWAPVNESKKYFVPEKPEFNLEEYDKLLKMYRIYHTQIKSLRKYFRDELEQVKQLSEAKSTLDAERSAADALLKINDEWNRETAKKREERELRESQNQEEGRLAFLIEMEENAKRQRELGRISILQEQEAAKSFIDLSNIENEIEKALDSRVNYNYAIDLEGNRYVGLPEDQEILNQTEKEVQQTQKVP